jgi:hypothetical protein
MLRGLSMRGPKWNIGAVLAALDVYLVVAALFLWIIVRSR